MNYSVISGDIVSSTSLNVRPQICGGKLKGPA